MSLTIVDEASKLAIAPRPATREELPVLDLGPLLRGEPLDADLKKYVRDEDMARYVIELPGVAHEDLCALYSAAEFLLFPSLHEGFGWPIIPKSTAGFLKSGF